MSQENVEIVRRMYQAVQSGDTATARSFFDPEFIVDASARPDGATGRGWDAMVRIIGEWMDAFEGWREEIEEVRDIGDQVVAVATQRGRSKLTGIDVEARYAVVYEISGRRITRMTLHRTPAEALDAAGLSE